MTKEVDFEDGLGALTRILGSIPKRPYFVGVYGEPNAGKTYLIEQIVRKCFDNDTNKYQHHQEEVSERFIKQILESDSLGQMMHFFECGWERILVFHKQIQLFQAMLTSFLQVLKMEKGLTIQLEYTALTMDRVLWRLITML